MPPNYSKPNVRAAATARAAQMMKLFNKKHFADIMNAVDPPPIKEPAFTNACTAAGLDPTEIAWLKAYLSQCDQARYIPIPDAAVSGW